MKPKYSPMMMQYLSIKEENQDSIVMFLSLIHISNVLGAAFMDSRNSNPFDVIDDYLDLQQDIHIIDFHGETTSEKIAFTHYVKDKVNGAILGTHTHVQTADEKIIDGKVAFISDVGMTGPYMSCLLYTSRCV